MIPAHVRIEALALIHGLVNPEGDVNYNAFGRRTNISPSTVMRICKKRDAEYTFNRNTLNALVAAFEITMDQAMGLVAIEPDEPTRLKPNTLSIEPDTDEHLLISSYARLSREGKRDLLNYALDRVKLHQIESCPSCGGPMEHIGRKEIPDEFGVEASYECYACISCAETDRARSIVQRLKTTQ